MIKRVLSLLAALFFLPLAIAMAQDQPALYTGKPSHDAQIYAQASLDARKLGYALKNHTLEILEVEPAWLKVRTDKFTGYMRRHYMIDASIKTVNPRTTPPYGTVECGWLAWVAGEAPVLDEPRAGATALITLQKGARLALMDINDGWGRLIYRRQYAYINTNLLSEIQPVNQAAAPGEDAPIAAYTSFYRTSQEGSNPNRMINIQVACDRFSLYTLQQGDKLDFNKHIGPYSRSIGYLPANALVGGETIQGYGGGTCQVSSTLYNVVLQLPGVEILHRRPHGPSAASYLPHGADAAVGNKTQNFIIRNRYSFPIRIDGTAQDGALTIAVYRAD
jgi:hypothetical protein